MKKATIICFFIGLAAFASCGRNGENSENNGGQTTDTSMNTGNTDNMGNTGNNSGATDTGQPQNGSYNAADTGRTSQ